VEYRQADQKLFDSVRRYNEAICDFTAECVAGIPSFYLRPNASEDRDMRIADIKERHDEGFLQWISSSHWEVEAQLQTLQTRYKECSTLQWAHRMSEFQVWLKSDLQPNTKERVLWIVGPPGVGKSTLAAYFLEFTQTLDSNDHGLLFHSQRTRRSYPA
jgi:ABC-type glutathione transport system ATPase component